MNRKFANRIACLFVMIFCSNSILAATGNITATLKNVNGVNAPAAGTKFILYTSPLQTKTGSNPATFSNILTGTYWLEGYYTGTFFGTEYWGSKQVTATTGTVNTTLTRYEPYAAEVHVYNGTTELTSGQLVAPNTPLQVKVTVKNNYSGALSSCVHLLFDRDKASPYDFDRTSSYQSISGGGGTKVYTFDITPSATGQYYYALEVTTTVESGNSARTDSWTWTQTFNIESGNVVIYSSQSYTSATRLLSLSARVVDTLYGNVTSGTFTWTLKDSLSNTRASGNMSYNSSAGEWRSSQTINGGLVTGNYNIYYNITTDRGRTGALTASLAVGSSIVTVTGTIKDGATSSALADAKVALFDASTLWSFVNTNYGGSMPPLDTLLTQLSPMRGPVLTSANGNYAWTDVPAGYSCVVIAGRTGYLGNYTPSFPVPATSVTIYKDVLLSPDVAKTLAALTNDVDMLSVSSENVLNYNAGIMADMTMKAKTDNLFGDETALDMYNKLASWYAIFAVSPEQITTLGDYSGFIGGMSNEAMLRVALGTAAEHAIYPLAKDAGKRVLTTTYDWWRDKNFPLDKTGYKASALHQEYLNDIVQAKSDYRAIAPTTNLDTEFDLEKARRLFGDTKVGLDTVTNGSSVFLVSPSPDDGIGRLKLETMTRQYDELSKWCTIAGGTETVLSTVQVAGTSVTLYTAYVAAGSGGTAAAPAAGVATVAYTAKEVAGWIKPVVSVVKHAVMTEMTNVFGLSFGTYLEDNSIVLQQFVNTATFMQNEAQLPYYLSHANKFATNTEVDLHLSSINIGNKSYLYIFTWSDLTADGTASLTVQNTGNVMTQARITGYGVWSPITLTGLLGPGAHDILTCAYICGPMQVAPNNTTVATMPYRGYSRNFLSQFKPHYLTVDTYSGPWHTNQVTKQYYVIGLGENPLYFIDLIGFSSMNAATKESYVAPIASSEGRMSLQELQSQISGSGELAQALLSAANPELTVSFTAEPNLYTSDLRLFAPQDASVSILVYDSFGKRIGYDTQDGMTYNELLGSVTNMGQRPISLCLLEPVAGETYTVEVALLSPGPDEVSVNLFYEPVKKSGALMTVFPSQIIIDGNDGTTHTALLRLAEASGQKALTDVNVVLEPIENWDGSVTLPIIGDSYQDIGNIPAGEQRSATWEVNYPAGVSRGKYVGVAVVSSAETSELEIPVVALVRDSNQTVTFYEGPDPNVAVVQRSLTLGADGKAQTWVYIPSGYKVVHAAMGVVGASANLQNPSVDIGADGSVEWAFSGKFDIGVLVDNVENAFNDYLTAHSSPSGGTNVPILIHGNPNEILLLNGIQLFLDNIVANKVDTPTIDPNGGTFPGSQQVTLSCSTTDAIIRYTTNASVPDSNSTPYSSPFTVSSSCTVKTKGFKSGYTDSDVASANFVIVPSKPKNPSPSNGAADQPINVDLNWSNGGGATNYDVYFGTDFDDVNEATTLTAVIYKGRQVTTSYDPGTLAYSTTYYWRIDSNNTSGTTTGDVWSFTTEPTPEVAIEVRQGAIVIVDDQNEPIDFGSVVQNSTAPELTFTIYNIGDANLEIGSVDLLNNNGFEVTEQLETVVEPNNSTTFSLRMLTDTIGNKSADINFVNTDSDESPFNFSVTGIVTKKLSHIQISGLNEVEENSGAQYTCTAYYSDGNTSDVTSSAIWDENSPYAAISSTGYLTTLAVPSDQPCRITATFEGKSANYDITIKDTSPILIKKCLVTAGKTNNSDMILILGQMSAAADDFNDANYIQVTIDSNDMVNPLVRTFPINETTFKNGKYNYARTENASKRLFKYDTKNGKFTFMAKNVDLSGLGCPLTIEIKVGNYVGVGEADEDVVNGPQKPIPIQLMIGFKDSLRVDKIQIPIGKRLNSHRWSVKGGFAVEDPNVSMAYRISEGLVITSGTQKFTIPATELKAGKDKFTFKNAHIVEGGLATGGFYFKTCVFMITIKNITITTGFGAANFCVEFAGFSECVPIVLP